MLDQKKAADYFIVAWCKDWTLIDYFRVVAELPNNPKTSVVYESCKDLTPWADIGKDFYAFKRPVRFFVSTNYPKLSSWLISRNDNISRLSYSKELIKMKPKNNGESIHSKEDLKELEKTKKEYKSQLLDYEISRTNFKEAKKSQWNVCS
jgi:hypothetical protein